MDYLISTLPSDTTVPDFQPNQRLPLPVSPVNRSTQLTVESVPRSDSLLLTFPAAALAAQLHIRNREPRCWSCTMDRKRCTIAIQESDRAPCRRCQSLGHDCSNDPKEQERRKLTLLKCDGCRERKQKCEFDKPWPEKCRLCRMHGRPCSEPRVAARGRARPNANSTTCCPPAAPGSHTSHNPPTAVAPSSRSTSTLPVPPSGLDADHATTAQHSTPTTPPNSPGRSLANRMAFKRKADGCLTLDFSSPPSPGASHSAVEWPQAQYKRPTPFPSSNLDRPLPITSADPSRSFESRADASNPLTNFSISAEQGRGPSAAQCKYCGATFRGLARHVREVHKKRTLIDCPEESCSRKGSNGFGRPDNLRQHLRLVHKVSVPKSSSGVKRKVGSD